MKDERLLPEPIPCKCGVMLQKAYEPGEHFAKCERLQEAAVTNLGVDANSTKSAIAVEIVYPELAPLVTTDPNSLVRFKHIMFELPRFLRLERNKQFTLAYAWFLPKILTQILESKNLTMQVRARGLVRALTEPKAKEELEQLLARAHRTQHESIISQFATRQF